VMRPSAVVSTCGGPDSDTVVTNEFSYTCRAARARCGG
jgi:hypothetical protein